MITARELLEEGRLAEAVEALTLQVRERPSDGTLRMTLFELLLFTGDWERALKHLDVAARQDAQSELGAQVYRNNIAAMRGRERLWAEGTAPHFLSEPPADVDLHLSAIDECRAGRPAEARKLLAKAEKQREPPAGRVDGREFAGWRDADDTLAPVLELIISDKYTWLPFSQIKRVEFRPPKRLRDLVWCQASVETREGMIGEMFVPTLYEGSSRHADERVRLGRVTQWEASAGGGPERAVGLRLFLAGEEDLAIFEARRVEFD